MVVVTPAPGSWGASHPAHSSWASGSHHFSLAGHLALGSHIGPQRGAVITEARPCLFSGFLVKNSFPVLLSVKGTFTSVSVPNTSDTVNVKDMSHLVTHINRDCWIVSSSLDHWVVAFQIPWAKEAKASYSSWGRGLFLRYPVPCWTLVICGNVLVHISSKFWWPGFRRVNCFMVFKKTFNFKVFFCVWDHHQVLSHLPSSLPEVLYLGSFQWLRKDLSFKSRIGKAKMHQHGSFPFLSLLIFSLIFCIQKFS